MPALLITIATLHMRGHIHHYKTILQLYIVTLSCILTKFTKILVWRGRCDSSWLTQALRCAWQLLSSGEGISMKSVEEALQVTTFDPAFCGTGCSYSICKLHIHSSEDKSFPTCFMSSFPFSQLLKTKTFIIPTLLHCSLFAHLLVWM